MENGYCTCCIDAPSTCTLLCTKMYQKPSNLRLGTFGSKPCHSPGVLCSSHPMERGDPRVLQRTIPHVSKGISAPCVDFSFAFTVRRCLAEGQSLVTSLPYPSTYLLKMGVVSYQPVARLQPNDPATAEARQLPPALKTAIVALLFVPILWSLVVVRRFSFVPPSFRPLNQSA